LPPPPLSGLQGNNEDSVQHDCRGVRRSQQRLWFKLPYVLWFKLPYVFLLSSITAHGRVK